MKDGAAVIDRQIRIATMQIESSELEALYLAAEQRAARFRFLVELARDLTSAQGLDDILQLALERATAFSGYDSGSVLLLVDQQGPLEVRASVGADTVIRGTQVHDVARSVAGRALQERRPLILEGRGEEIGTQWRDYTKPLPSSVCLPLIAMNGEAIGVLALKSTFVTRELDNDDLDALQLLASQLAAVVQHAQLQERNLQLLQTLTERERQLADLVGRLLSAHEEERRRVAYELHDDLAQVAASAHQHLQAFASGYRSRSPHLHQQLNRALELAQRVVREVRRVIAGLRPTTLDDFGLAMALRLQTDALRADQWEIEYEETLGPERLPPTIETALFRIAQEALTNIRKHAQTNRVRMALRQESQLIRLEIRDWGCGFHETTSHTSNSEGEQIGLLSMRERTALLGGRFQIKSQEGGGTLIIVEIPLSTPQTGPIAL